MATLLMIMVTWMFASWYKVENVDDKNPEEKTCTLMSLHSKSRVVGRIFSAYFTTNKEECLRHLIATSSIDSYLQHYIPLDKNPSLSFGNKKRCWLMRTLTQTTIWYEIKWYLSKGLKNKKFFENVISLYIPRSESC